MIRMLTITAAAGVLVLGCTQPEEPSLDPFDQKQTSLSRTVMDEPATNAPPIDRSELEQRLLIFGEVDEGSAGPNVNEQKQYGKPNVMTMNIIEVTAPYPESFTIQYTVKPQLRLNNAAIALHGNITRDSDNAIIGAISTVLDSRLDKPNFKVNVLEGLEEPPESMLLLSKVRAVILREGTDFESVDPTKVEGSPEDTVQLFATPIRINFTTPGVGL